MQIRSWQRQNLIHLPGEPAGVLSKPMAPDLATESCSPAMQDGRGLWWTLSRIVRYSHVMSFATKTAV